jgi:hypothetical protein
MFRVFVVMKYIYNDAHFPRLSFVNKCQIKIPKICEYVP